MAGFFLGMLHICSIYGRRRRQQGRQKAGGREMGGVGAQGPKMGRSIIKEVEEEG
jgi:hypothetical protein